MLRTIPAVLLAGLVLAQAGCSAMRESSRQMIDAFKPGDYAMGDVSDPWIQQAGVEARGNRPRESLNEERWWYNMWTTEKARDIDRNLGYDAE